MNSSEVIIVKLCFEILFFICFIAYFVDFLDKYKVYEERVTKYKKWFKWFYKYIEQFEKDDDYEEKYSRMFRARPPMPSNPIFGFIIVLIIAGIFAYAFEILKIYLIIILPLMLLAAEIKMELKHSQKD